MIALFFCKRLGIFNPNFTPLLYVPVYARLQIFFSVTYNFFWLTLCECYSEYSDL